MKDKEKHIDEIEIREMARVFMTASCKGSNCENCLFIKTVNEAEQCCVCLKALYNAGYRKLPEDSVVLSKEEYIDLSRNYVGEQIAQARKETAEKIFNGLHNIVDAIMEDDIKEMIKREVGIEIKE